MAAQRLALPAGLRPCGAGCGALRATVTNALHKQRRLAATACKAQSKFSITRVSARKNCVANRAFRWLAKNDFQALQALGRPTMKPWEAASTFKLPPGRCRLLPWVEL
jgi:hypothetical protein